MSGALSLSANFFEKLYIYKGWKVLRCNEGCRSECKMVRTKFFVPEYNLGKQ